MRFCRFKAMINDKDRHIKDKDQLAWNLVLQELARLCMKFIDHKYILPRLRDSLEASMYYDVPGLPFKTKIDEIKLGTHIPYYIEKKKMMNDIDIWNNPLKRCGLMEELEYKRARDEVILYLQVLADHGALQEAKGFIEEGTEMVIS